MAKARGPRHSKNVKQPVTINLEAVESGPDKEEVPTGTAAAAFGAGTEPENLSPSQTGSARTGEAPDEIDSTAADGEVTGDTEDTPATDQPAPEASSATSATDAPQQHASRRTGLLTAAILGGIIALAGAAALQWTGVIPTPRPDNIPLEQLSGAVSAIEERLGNMERAAGDMAARAGTGAGDLETRLSATESAIEALGAAMPAGTELARRVNAIEERMGDGAGMPVAPQDVSAAIRPLDEKLSDLQQKLDAAVNSAEKERAALASRIAVLESGISKLGSAVENQAGRPDMARAIAAAALKSAIDRGDPFMTELEIYAAIAGESAEIGSLRNLAAAGVPTQSELAKDIAERASGIIASAEPVAPDAGVVDRLLASARSLVKVRPVGEVEGESASAIVARMEADINAGDLQAALGEYESLPEPAKTAAGPLAEKIRARLTADTIIASSVAGALAPAGSANE